MACRLGLAFVSRTDGEGSGNGTEDITDLTPAEQLLGCLKTLFFGE